MHAHMPALLHREVDAAIPNAPDALRLAPFKAEHTAPNRSRCRRCARPRPRMWEEGRIPYGVAAQTLAAPTGRADDVCISAAARAPRSAPAAAALPISPEPIELRLDLALEAGALLSLPSTSAPNRLDVHHTYMTLRNSLAIYSSGGCRVA